MEEKTILAKVSQHMANNAYEEAQKLIIQGMEAYSESAPLLFLSAALNAQLEDYESALHYYEQSLNIAPDFHIARFQCGLLLATLGNKDKSIDTLQPLENLKDHYLGQFAAGVIATLNENMDEAITAIETGIALNQENPSLTNDMRAMLERVVNHKNESSQETAQAEEDKSHLLDIYQAKH